jgi:hypothetical protein
MKPAPSILSAVLLSAIAACGDPLVTADDRGDPVFAVHGQAVDPLHELPASDYRVAVLFLRTTLTTEPTQKLELETRVMPGTISGAFPAAFHVDFDAPPVVYPYDLNIVYGTIGGGQTTGVFDARHAPDGVRIGQLVIGPAAELDALPHLIPMALEDRTIGAVLAPFLPHTTVTSYQVIYAEGVGAGDVIYPAVYPDHVAGGLPISDGFTLVDARTYFEATIWQECANRVLNDTYGTPAYATCLADNAPLIDCVATCDSAPGGRTPACYDHCKATYPDQIEHGACLFQVAQPALDATCGPEQKPRENQVHVVPPGTPLSVTLGDDDVRAGLWILHVTRY